LPWCTGLGLTLGADQHSLSVCPQSCLVTNSIEDLVRANLTQCNREFNCKFAFYVDAGGTDGADRRGRLARRSGRVGWFEARRAGDDGPDGF
jgi:hypothetical protein